MQKKRSGIIGFIVFFVLLLLITPYFLGHLTERAFNNYTDSLPPDSNVKIKVLNYQRGWFSSTAILQISISPKPQDSALQAPIALNVQEKIWHGPLIAAKNLHGHLRLYLARAFASGSLSVSDTARTTFINNAKPNAPLKNQILLSLFGNLAIKTYVANINFHSFDQKMILSLFDVKIKYKINASHNHQKGKTEIGQLIVHSDGEEVDFEKLHYEFDLSKSISQLWTGKTNSTIETIKLSFDGKPELIGSQLKMRSQLKLEGDLLSSHIQLAINHLNYQNKLYGPLKADFSAKNIEPHALGKLKALLKAMQDNKNKQVQSLRVIKSLLVPLLGRGAQFHLNPLEVKTPDGAIVVYLNVTFPNLDNDTNKDILTLLQKAESANQFMLPKKSFYQLLYAFYMSEYKKKIQNTPTFTVSLSDIQVEKLIDTETQAKIKTWQEKGYLIEKNNNFWINMHYKDNRFYLNDQILH